MSDSVQLNVRVPSSVAVIVGALSADLGISKSAVLRRALGVLQAFEEARAAGHYVGTTRVREHLDTVIVGPV